MAESAGVTGGKVIDLMAALKASLAEAKPAARPAPLRPGAIFREFLEELAHERIEKHEQTFFRLSVAEDVELLAQIFEPFLIDDRRETTFAEMLCFEIEARGGHSMEASRDGRFPCMECLNLADSILAGHLTGRASAPVARGRFCSSQTVVSSAAHVCELYDGHAGDHECRQHNLVWPPTSSPTPAQDALGAEMAKPVLFPELPLLGSNQDSPDPESPSKGDRVG